MSKSGLVTLILEILRSKNSMKSEIIALVGDISPYISDENGSLSEICRLLTISIRYNDSNLATAGY